jgi:hypothetical protein
MFCKEWPPAIARFHSVLVLVGRRLYIYASHVDSDRSHAGEGITMCHDVGMHTVIERHLPVAELIFEVDIGRPDPQKAGNLRKRQIVRGNESNGAAIQ